MAAAIGSYGGATLLYLLKLIAVYYAASLFFVFGVLGSISWSIGLPFMAVLRLIRDEILLVFPTIRTLEQLEPFGSAAELLEWAAGREVVPLQPRVVMQGETARIVLPGEPGYEA